MQERKGVSSNERTTMIPGEENITKKIISLILTAACLSTMVTASFAASISADFTHSADNDAITAIAYRDVGTAETIEEYYSILSARNILIYGGQSWTIDGAVKVFNADGSVEELPDFYDLFPSDWEPGRLPQRLYSGNANTPDAKSSALYAGNIYFAAASSDYEIDPFGYKTLPRDGAIGIYPASIPENAASFNAGFYNEDTQRGIGWAASLPEGKGVFLADAEMGTRYGFVVSVCGSPGYGDILVDYLDSDAFPVDVHWGGDTP